MTYPEILAAARECIGPYCKACPVCNGRACGNAMPGPGCKYPGQTAARNFDKWQEICVNMDTLCPNAEPDIRFTLFGHEFAAPIFAAPLGALPLHYGDKYKDQEYNRILIKAAAEYGLMALTGDGVDPEIMKASVVDMGKAGGMGCPTIKPWNKEFVCEKLDVVNAAGIFAVAMDVDGAGLPFLKAMNPNAGSKSVEEMREIIEYAKMPFILKGIMTPAGARPAIVEAVEGRIPVIVDGGIRSGVDVFRALALGADAVLIGRPVLTAIYGAGEEGFRVYMDKIVGELKSTMTMCGAASLADINRDKIWLG